MSNVNILRIKKINKQFGFNQILNDVSIDFFSGEIHAVLGENACGKSTLIKIISGTMPADSGEMFYNESVIDTFKLSNIKNLKVETVFQGINLFDNMTVAENIYIKNLPSKTRMPVFIDYKKLNDAYHSSSRILNINIDPNIYVGQLSHAQKRLVEITKALVSDPDILILDEPMESFSDDETDLLYKILTEQKKLGKIIIIITHKIEQALKMSDKITVLYDGTVADTITTKNTDDEKLLKLISGKELKNRYPKIYAKKGTAILSFQNISGGVLKDISFSLYEGEVLGITGLLGNGKSTVGKIIMGLEKIQNGRLYINGVEIKQPSPSKMLKRGFGYIAEESIRNLIPTLSPSKNITLSNIKKISKLGFLNLKKERTIRDYFYRLFSISDRHKNVSVNFLSGGTQQKICISKILYSKIKTMILDEPTIGLDSSSKSDVYNFMNDFVSKGNSIILLSSDFSEVAGMCDRVIILRDGRLIKCINHTELTKEKIILYSTKDR